MRVESLAEGRATDHLGKLLGQLAGQRLVEGGRAAPQIGEAAATALEELAALLQQPLLRDCRRVGEAGGYTIEQRVKRLAATAHVRVE